MTSRLARSAILIVASLMGFQFNSRTSARAEQITVRQPDYSNDLISDHGKTAACVVTLLAASPPDPRTLNFQFLSFKQSAGWKITGSLVDWNTSAMTALRARDGSFSSSSFTAPGAFEKSLTPEAQLVGILTQPDHLQAFISEFFTAPYTVAVTWQGSPDEVT